MAKSALIGNAASPLTRLDAEQVAEVYRGLLGREPESREVVKEHLERNASLAAFIQTVLGSDEYRRRAYALSNAAVMGTLRDAYWSTPGVIEHEVSSETMTRLVDRIRAQWTLLGETEPHWSVLTNDVYKAKELDEAAITEFYKSGEASARIIDLFEQRTGIKARRGVCLELGCGVGRITEHLSSRFEKVIGVDISPGNLALCRQRMEAVGQVNVDLRQVGEVADFDALPEFDFFYSIIVLQHNSPPIQKAILRSLLGKVKAGGGALFQIPTEMAEYQFEADSYLATPSPDMEVHGLPKAVVLDEVRRAGLQIVDLIPDSWINKFGSYTFYAVKPM